MDGGDCRPTPSPTNQPIVQPSNNPTVQPTSNPTGRPTVQSTGQPTITPTDQPTSEPESTPSPTLKPTTEPDEGFVSVAVMEVAMTSEVIPSTDDAGKLKDVFIAELGVDASDMEDVRETPPNKFFCLPIC